MQPLKEQPQTITNHSEHTHIYIYMYVYTYIYIYIWHCIELYGENVNLLNKVIEHLWGWPPAPDLWFLHHSPMVIFGQVLKNDQQRMGIHHNSPLQQFIPSLFLFGSFRIHNVHGQIMFRSSFSCLNPTFLRFNHRFLGEKPTPKKTWALRIPRALGQAACQASLWWGQRPGASQRPPRASSVSPQWTTWRGSGHPVNQ